MIEITRPSEETLPKRLESARRELLDLSARNRLNNTPLASTSVLTINDERTSWIFKILVSEGKAMRFLPRLQSTPESPSNPNSHDDLFLRTALDEEKLGRRLLRLFQDARTFFEEQGVEVLYLATGFLKWFEDDRSEKARFAPLLLIPVSLERLTVGAPFRLARRPTDLETNLSLQEKLKTEFQIGLPDLPEEEELIPDQYFAAVREAISSKKRWEVCSDVVALGFFSFSKFLMYRDLDPSAWPAEKSLGSNPLLKGLVEGRLRPEELGPADGPPPNLDGTFHPRELVHVLDADSSQALAIEEARRGRNLVIQGPPGTGKSQTIANLIAGAVKDGRRILFVAEKMAALEVVKNRLEKLGLAEICLELHSHKANKKAVLAELGNTLNLQRPSTARSRTQAEDLARCRDRLNRYKNVLHTRLEPSGRTPFEIITQLISLRRDHLLPEPCHLEDALKWGPADFLERCRSLVELSEQAKKIGPPLQHSWRGVGLTAVSPPFVDRLRRALSDLLARLDEAGAQEHRLRQLLSVPEDALGPLSQQTLPRLAEHLGHVPHVGRTNLRNPRWEMEWQEIAALVREGERLSNRRKNLEEKLSSDAFNIDPLPIAEAIRTYGRSWFRFFSRKFRRAKADARSLLAPGVQLSSEAELELLDDLAREQRAVGAFQGDGIQNERGQEAFGDLWKGRLSHWDSLKALVDWEARGREMGLPGAFRRLGAQIASPGDVLNAGRALVQAQEGLKSEAAALFADLQLDLRVAFGRSAVSDISQDELRRKVIAWRDTVDGLRDWLRYDALRAQSSKLGLSSVVRLLEGGTITAETAVPLFSQAFYEALLAHVQVTFPEVSHFDGPSHDREVARFRELDRERIALTRTEVEESHRARLPHPADFGEVGVIQQELKKKRRHRPLRVLLADAGRAVQAMKPVFLMSPLSVAQFLKPGSLEFDLLLIDEASQVKPVDALGAIARARQVVVVGDDKQLPPTKFFDRAAADVEGDEGTFEAGDVESILDLCATTGMRSRMLRWHYRSKHASLIALSNRELYGSQLIVPPSAGRTDHDLGLKFRYITSGVYDRSGSASNRGEARAVAEAVVDHARLCPEKTLGVGTFSVAQRDAIEEELEGLRKGRKELDGFFSPQRADRFFVKNLENIQGDERDVILISVGYARDASGKMFANFGPLSTEGGEKRLNVLITRARERCEVFASIKADDLDLRTSTGRGPHLLKSFLKYAETGTMDVPRSQASDYDSEFERHVASRLREKGFTVDSQIGTAGFFIDLAVLDPERPGRYLLGIECDGAQYHSSQWARDRDRLRQEILEGRGWTIHRIWSTDWFYSPDRQMGLLLAAIERAVSRSKSDGAKQAPTAQAPMVAAPPSAVRKNVSNAQTDGAEPYEEAEFSVNTAVPIPEIPVDALAQVLRRIVEVEGPIHEKEIGRRTTGLWGFKRTGDRIGDAVVAALRYLVSRSRLSVEDGFYAIPNLPIRVRRRDEVKSLTLRKAEFLPPTEIRAAILLVIERGIGVARDEAREEALHLMGFKSISENLSSVADAQVDWLVRNARVDTRDGRLYLRAPSNQVP